jgi:hypothetical protein
MHHLGVRSEVKRECLAFQGDRPMNDRVCYLHVGTGKTGSSTIQFAFARAHDVLKAHGYLYPNAAKNFRHVLSGIPTAGNARHILMALRDGSIEDAIRQIEPYAGDDRHLVLSSEGFANRSAAVWTEFASGLRSLGYRPKCLVFFRPHSELAVSSYLQLIKSERTTVSLSEYVSPSFRRSWLATAEKLEQAVGESNLTVKWYPAIKRQGPDAIVRAAFDWLGAASLYELVKLSQAETIINPTPGQEALEILRIVNARGLGGRKAFADEFLRIAQARGLLGAKVTLDYSELHRIHAATAKDNELLLRRYCPDLSPEREIAPPIIDNSPQPPDEEVLRELRLIARDLLRRKTLNPIRRRKINELLADKTATKDQCDVPRVPVAGREA